MNKDIESMFTVFTDIAMLRSKVVRQKDYIKEKKNELERVEKELERAEKDLVIFSSSLQEKEDLAEGTRLSWEFVFDTDRRWKETSRAVAWRDARRQTLEAGYRFFVFNNNVYHTDAGEMTVICHRSELR